MLFFEIEELKREPNAAPLPPELSTRMMITLSCMLALAWKAVHIQKAEIFIFEALDTLQGLKFNEESTLPLT